MKISHALPNPQHAPAARERTAVPGVAATDPVRDDSERRRPPHAAAQLNDGQRAALDERAGVYAAQHAASHRANRALAAYATVAEDGERDALRHMLGFDTYA